MWTNPCDWQFLRNLHLSSVFEGSSSPNQLFNLVLLSSICVLPLPLFPKNIEFHPQYLIPAQTMLKTIYFFLTFFVSIIVLPLALTYYLSLCTANLFPSSPWQCFERFQHSFVSLSKSSHFESLQHHIPHKTIRSLNPVFINF